MPSPSASVAVTVPTAVVFSSTVKVAAEVKTGGAVGVPVSSAEAGPLTACSRVAITRTA